MGTLTFLPIDAGTGPASPACADAMRIRSIESTDYDDPNSTDWAFQFMVETDDSIPAPRKMQTDDVDPPRPGSELRHPIYLWSCCSCGSDIDYRGNHWEGAVQPSAK